MELTDSAYSVQMVQFRLCSRGVWLCQSLAADWRAGSPGFSFIGILEGRPVQHDCTLYLATLKHAELSNAVFSTAAEFYELL
jgi:hypothetical protein